MSPAVKRRTQQTLVLIRPRIRLLILQRLLMFLTAALKVAVREAEVVTADEVLTTLTPSLSILFLLLDSMGKVLVPPDPRVTVPLCVRVVMAACSRLPLSGVRPQQR
jgi:hypothetical protein